MAGRFERIREDMARRRRLFKKSQFARAAVLAVYRLNPMSMKDNSVLFVVWAAAVVVSVLLVNEAIAGPPPGTSQAPGLFYYVTLTAWLWFTLWLCNFAESLAEERGRAEASALKASRRRIISKRLKEPEENRSPEMVPATTLKKGDFLLVEIGDTIGADSEVVSGVASLDESALTGESAAVIRRPGDRVLGGTKLLSDRLVVRVTTAAGGSFIDRMISMVEGVERRRTPNEVSLSIMLSAMAAVLLLSCVTLVPFSFYAAASSPGGEPLRVMTAVSILVCVLPTTIAGLLTTVGIAGMDRMLKANVVAMSGRAVEAAGDVDIVLLDKTGTITVGNRDAIAFIPVAGVEVTELALAAAAASVADETPEGRSILRLARERYNTVIDINQYRSAKFVTFSAVTRISGIDIGPRKIRKGSIDAVEEWLASRGSSLSEKARDAAVAVARRGSTPIIVVDSDRVLGTVEMKDVLKRGVREQAARLRRIGVRTVMLTGDNKYTASAIVAEAGLDDFVSEAAPEDKLRIVKSYKAEGKIVAMTGDGTNDAPALAEADVALVMASGTQAAREAGNMIDLDSNPAKLIDIIEIGKQILLTRGALTAFSISSDLAKYFSIIPVTFAIMYPELEVLNFLGLSSPQSAVLSVVIFNALIILLLIPVAVTGVGGRGLGAMALLRRNLLIYGVGGFVAPFFLIKLIDLAISWLGLV